MYKSFPKWECYAYNDNGLNIVTLILNFTGINVMCSPVSTLILKTW